MTSASNVVLIPEAESGAISIDAQIRSLLIAGIHGGWVRQQDAIARVREIRPDLSLDSIDEYMQALAAEGLPSWLKPGFWTSEMDQMLIAGIQRGGRAERKAIDKILRLRPELRPEVIWGRMRHLRRRRRGDGHRGVPFKWTADLDAILREHCQRSEIDAGVSHVQSMTRYPKDVILRRARRLGLPKRHVSTSRTWTAAEVSFLVESVQHVAVDTIARELRRTEKAIWRKVAELGLSGKCIEGYTVTEILEKLHVSHARLKKWIDCGWLKVGRNGRLTERSVRSFLREHCEELNWAVLDSDTRQWLFEIGVKGPF